VILVVQEMAFENMFGISERDREKEREKKDK